MYKLTLFLSLFLLITSCAPTNNFQLYKTKAPDLKVDKGLLVFEDSVCSISYDLWSKNGNKSGFSIEAKVIFNSSTGTIIKKGDFEFYNSTLIKKPKGNNLRVSNQVQSIQNGAIPFFSLFAVLLLIIFRNRFFGSFQKYF